MKMKNLIGAALASVMITGAASAATLSFEGTSTTAILPAGNSLGFSLEAETGLSQGDTVTVFNAANDGGLAVTPGAKIRVTYLGSEAKLNNSALELSIGTVLFNNQTSVFGDTAAFLNAGPAIGLKEFVGFLFKSQGSNSAREIENGNTGAAGANLSIGFSEISTNGRSVIALLGDGTGDLDFDDLAIRISVVPLPAGGLLLLTALGGMGLARRKKKAA